MSNLFNPVVCDHIVADCGLPVPLRTRPTVVYDDQGRIVVMSSPHPSSHHGLQGGLLAIALGQTGFAASTPLRCLYRGVHTIIQHLTVAPGANLRERLLHACNRHGCRLMGPVRRDANGTITLTTLLP